MVTGLERSTGSVGEGTPEIESAGAGKDSVGRVVEASTATVELLELATTVAMRSNTLTPIHVLVQEHFIVPYF